MPAPSPSAHAPSSTSRPDLAPPPAAEPLVSLAEAAEMLGVHYMTAYRYVRTGLLPAQQRQGRWQVAANAVEAVAASRESAAGSRTSGTDRRRHRHSTGTLRSTALADRLIAGDEPGAWRIVEDAVAVGRRLDDVYLGLLGPALTEVGERWETGRATVADEHRATVVAMRLIGRSGPRAARPGRTLGTVVVAAAPGDRHALPSALLADLLRERGFGVVDLGADTPPEFVAAAAGVEDRLVAVGLCATTPLTRSTSRLLAEAVDLVHQGTGVPVLLGGRAADEAAARRAGADATADDAQQAIRWFEGQAEAARSGRAGA